jgi:hypothetical protein
MNKGVYFWKCALFILLAVAVVGFVLMALWNWLVPVLFQGPAITYWQAMGLLLLSKILFSGLGAKRAQACDQNAAPYWKNRLYEKFSTMKPEDREAFKQKMKDKWCSWEQKSDVDRERLND